MRSKRIVCINPARSIWEASEARDGNIPGSRRQISSAKCALRKTERTDKQTRPKSIDRAADFLNEAQWNLRPRLFRRPHTLGCVSLGTARAPQGGWADRTATA